MSRDIKQVATEFKKESKHIDEWEVVYTREFIYLRGLIKTRFIKLFSDFVCLSVLTRIQLKKVLLEILSDNDDEIK